MELIDHMPVTRRNGKLIVGEGVKFERIRRITGYLVGLSLIHISEPTRP